MGRKDYFPELFKVIGCHRGALEFFMGERHAQSREKLGRCGLKLQSLSFILLLSMLYTGEFIFFKKINGSTGKCLTTSSPEHAKSPDLQCLPVAIM